MPALDADQLVQSVRDVDASSFASDAERQKVRDALTAALRRVQTPFDIAQDHVWTQPATTAAIKVLIDAGFWKKWVAAGSQPGTTDSLALTTGFDALLLRRLLRMLAGERLVTETARDTFAPTHFSKALGQEQFPSLYTMLYEFNQPCFANYPGYAAETKYSSSTDPEYNNFHSWAGRGQSMFTLLSAKPDVGPHIMNTMAVYSAAKTPWPEVYPTETIIAAAKPGKVLLVDVGGGSGHDLEKFRAKHPNVPQGSLVVQDLPDVVKYSRVQEPCIVQEHDFFTPQPIKGARTYYLHMILHDWPDVKAVEILKHIASSMEKGYSRILLHEAVILPEKAHPRTTLSDVVMMMSLGAVERTEEDWYDLIGQAGLKIVKIWAVPQSVESIIEAELL